MMSMATSEHHLQPSLPSNLYKPTAPLTATVVENTRINPNSSNAVHHVVLQYPEASGFYYVDGQSLGVLPPGQDAATGKAHKLRLYSIASPSTGEAAYGPNSVTLCVKRFSYTNEAGEQVLGVCSNFIGDLKVGDTVQATGPVGKSFLLPNNPHAPILMIATGTGIAPFRAFLQRRHGEQGLNSQGESLLVFGAQYTTDYLYQSELETLQAKHPQVQVLTAFSREQQNEQGERLYVQHRLYQERARLIPFLQHPEATLYICGLRGMEEGIEQALAQAATEAGLCYDTLKSSMKAEGRWHVEVY